MKYNFGKGNLSLFMDRLKFNDFNANLIYVNKMSKKISSLVSDTVNLSEDIGRDLQKEINKIIKKYSKKKRTKQLDKKLKKLLGKSLEKELTNVIKKHSKKKRTKQLDKKLKKLSKSETKKYIKRMRNVTKKIQAKKLKQQRTKMKKKDKNGNKRIRSGSGCASMCPPFQPDCNKCDGDDSDEQPETSSVIKYVPSLTGEIVEVVAGAGLGGAAAYGLASAVDHGVFGGGNQKAKKLVGLVGAAAAAYLAAADFSGPEHFATFTGLQNTQTVSNP